MIKANKGDFYFYNDEGELKSFKSQNLEMALEICEYCIAKKSGLKINAKPDSESNEEVISESTPFSDADITTSTICINLGLQEGDFGAIILQDPVYFDKFFKSDYDLIEIFASTFSILLKNGWSNVDSREIFLSFKSSLLLLLENANLIQKKKQTEYTLNAVLEVSNLINSSRELHEMIQTVLYSARKVIRAESASLFLMDEETGELYFDIVSGEESNILTGIRIPQGQGIAGICAQEKKSILVNDAQNDPRHYKKVDDFSQTITRNILAAPLVVNNVTIGVIEVLNTIDRAGFSELDLELFESFSDSVAIALQRRRILDDLELSTQQLEQHLSEITCLHEVSGALVDATNIEEMFENVLKIIRRSLDVGRVSVILADETSGRLTTVARESDIVIENGDVSDDDSGTSLSEYVISNNESLFIGNINESKYSQYSRPGRYRSNSCILIPMASARDYKPFGVLCVTESASGFFTDEDYRLLTTITSNLVRGYVNFKLNEEIIAKKAYEKELEITSNIQQNILPSRKIEHEYVEIAAKSVMARTTGGDFYDYYVHGENGEITMLVADVSGKSLPAALFMAVSSSILRTIIRSVRDPTQILQQSNELLYEESESGMFVTVFLAKYEPSTGLLRYASAGHNEMLLLKKDGSLIMLSGKGPPLGVMPGNIQKYIGGELSVSEGDLLILYTDGVVEAVNPEYEEYGMDNFIKLLNENRSETPEDIIEKVYDDVFSFSNSDLQYDDFTMLVSRFDVVPSINEYSITMPAITESIPSFRNFMFNICIRHAITGYNRDDILLISDEAATNIVMHAYKDTDDDNPSFDCKCQINNNMLCLTFKDRGRPFSHEKVKKPDIRENIQGKRKGGFGVYLINRLMDRAEFLHQDGINYLYVEKKLD